MSPAHVEAELAQSRRPARAPRPGHSRCGRRPRRVHLDQDRGPRRPAGRSRRPRPPRPPSASSRPAGPARRTLLGCTAPRKCHRAPAAAGPSSARLGHQFLGVVLADVRRGRRPAPPRTASAPKPLVTATTRTAPGITAGRLDPPADVARARSTASGRRRRRGVSAGTTGRRSRRPRGRSPRRRWRRRRCRPARDGLQAENLAALAGRLRPTPAGRPPSSQRSKPGGDHRHPDLVAHVVVDHRAEDDVGVGVGHRVDDLGRLVDLEQAEVGPAGDVEQDAPGPLDRGLEQRAGDGGAGRVDRPALADRRADAHDGRAGVGHHHLHVGEVGVDEARAR